MIHQPTSTNPLGHHYGVSCCLPDLPSPSFVLAQIQEGASESYPHTEQARIRLTPEEARATLPSCC